MNTVLNRRSGVTCMDLPQPNPNKFDAVAEQGQKVFERERCATYDTPPLYTNNKLTAAAGFTVPPDH